MTFNSFDAPRPLAFYRRNRMAIRFFWGWLQLVAYGAMGVAWLAVWLTAP